MALWLLRHDLRTATDHWSPGPRLQGLISSFPLQFIGKLLVFPNLLSRVNQTVGWWGPPTPSNSLFLPENTSWFDLMKDPGWGFGDERMMAMASWQWVHRIEILFFPIKGLEHIQCLLVRLMTASIPAWIRLPEHNMEFWMAKYIFSANNSSERLQPNWSPYRASLPWIFGNPN